MRSPVPDIFQLTTKFKKELSSELANIFNYWIDNTIDKVNGGFVGRIDQNNLVDFNSAKGSVLNARILWSFSAGFNLTKNGTYLTYADKAYQYLTDFFLDKKCGGVYWSVDNFGNPLDTKKQVYVIVFTIYGFAEYYKASSNETAKKTAIELFESLVQYAYDTDKGGYLEAFAEDWKPIDDLRLSDKDANEKKTMNTHLHVLEAYSNLYSIWPNAKLRKQIESLITDFLNHIISPDTGHLTLFFDEHWNKKSDTISFGHDIEASWLLLEAAENINDVDLIIEIKKLAVQMAKNCIQALDVDFGMWYEKEPAQCHWIKDKHWWVQAEAMVGLVNAWELSKDDKFLYYALNNWKFVQQNILDQQYGEWHWGINEQGKSMPLEDKVGMWKCPYHNSRACMEIIRRL